MLPTVTMPALILCFWASAACAAITGGEYRIDTYIRDSGGGNPLSGGEYSARAAIAQSNIPDGTWRTGGGEYVNRVGFYNPPHFSYQRPMAVNASFGSGAMQLSIPANSVGKEYFDIILNKSPVSDPINVEPGTIANANTKIEMNEGAWSRLLPSNIAELCIFDEESFLDKPFDSRATIAMQYKDDNNDGIVDGTNPPVRAESLNIWMLDEALQLWVKVPDPVIDTASKRIIVPFSGAGVYAALGTIDDSVKNTYAFPVPFRPNGPNAGIGAGKTGTEAGGITFIHVPQKGDIDIYTIDGRLVKKLPIPANLALAELKWEVRNDSGEKVASGVYIWRVVSGSNSKTGKLMVIR
ncbi:MAG: T9SS type A sorting domain-containing protein [bacterium]